MTTEKGLWFDVLHLLCELRPVFSRSRTFFWFLVAIIGFITRTDLSGVTSFVRALGLKEHRYHALLGFFNRTGVLPDMLAKAWTKLVLRRYPGVMEIRGRVLLVADGIKIAKSGRCMPGVKRLHQQSESNTKPEYITGHSCQALGLLVKSVSQAVFCVPLVARIHEGIKYTPRDKRTQLDRLVGMVTGLDLDRPFLLIADAFYASGKVITPFVKQGNHLLCRTRGNAIGYEAPPPRRKGVRGRNKKYGAKVVLGELFKDTAMMAEVPSPYEGEADIRIQVRQLKLLWKPANDFVLFLLAVHPERGSFILMTTDVTMTATEMLYAYSLRFKIEVSFKQAIWTLGSYRYHFWSKKFRQRRIAGDRYFHRATEECRAAVRQKVEAYHRFIQVGLIAQGCLQYLACSCPERVWANFGSWLRTSNPNQSPSEAVTAVALRNSISQFLADPKEFKTFAKFLWANIDFHRAEGRRFAA